MSDPKYNAWLGMSAAFQSDMVQLVLNDVPATTFPLLNNMSQDTKDFFKGIHDAGSMDRLFRKWSVHDYRAWNCYVAKSEGGMGQIKSDLDAAVAAYPSDFSILGVWHYEDGRQIGTSWDESDPPVLIGTPTYPQPAQTINFMPDIPDPASPDPENPVMIRPTELSNVLLMFGQPARTLSF
ncbi:hypothetical protein N9937_01365 [bacterium]|nr:hypothetical protein [bacterium]